MFQNNMITRNITSACFVFYCAVVCGKASITRHGALQAAAISWNGMHFLSLKCVCPPGCTFLTLQLLLVHVKTIQHKAQMQCFLLILPLVFVGYPNVLSPDLQMKDRCPTKLTFSSLKKCLYGVRMLGRHVARVKWVQYLVQWQWGERLAHSLSSCRPLPLDWIDSGLYNLR